MGRLFGTDGIRGTANAELTPELAFRVGRAAAYYFGQRKNRKDGHYDEKPKIFLGKDTRISSKMLSAALEAGICSSGGDVVELGVVPTPAVSYLVRKHHGTFGIAVTASHNAFPDNGIKFFSNEGYKLSDAIEDELEKLIVAPKDEMPRPVADKIGNVIQGGHLLKEYVHFIKTLAVSDFNQMKIVIDCANGAAFESTPLAFRQLGAQITVLNSQPNGTNINDNCGSTHMEKLQEAVIKYKAHLGIAHDGDADRCLIVDENGEIVDGDQMMLICALDMMKQKKLAENTLVTTVMSNIGLYKAMERAGAKVVTTQVGDRYVLEEMRSKGYNFGGEQSGHIIFSDHNTTGDGLLTAVKLTMALKNSGKKMSELASLMVRYPQLLVNVRVKDKKNFLNNETIRGAILAGEQELGDDGRILVRPSGTEPLVRVMAEGPTKAVLERIVHNIADTVKNEEV
jgi:phosphoglucosamine mutase